MINKRKLVLLWLSATLIASMVLANSNIGPMPAAAAAPKTTTFDINHFKIWGLDGYMLGTPFQYITFMNATPGANITHISTGIEYKANATGWDSVPITPDTWIYGFGPDHASYRYPMLLVDQVWNTSSYTPSFNISTIFDFIFGTPGNITGITPSVPYIECDWAIETLSVGDWYFPIVNISVYPDTWWESTFGAFAGVRWHVNDTQFGFAIIDQVIAPNGTSVPSIDYVGPYPADSLGGIQLMTTLNSMASDPWNFYWIIDPAGFVPDAGSWWDLLLYGNYSGDFFSYNVSYAMDFGGGYTYFAVDTIWNWTSNAPVASLPLETIDWWGPASVPMWGTNLTKIATGVQYNVVYGSPEPTPQSWWNVTTTDPLDPSVVGTEFYVDQTGTWMRIDEVLGGNVTGLALNNVTAVELTPAIYVDPASIVNTSKTVGENFTVDIKTNYTMGIWGYEFTLNYNPEVLNATSVTNGDVVATGAGTTFYTTGIDEVAGKVKLTGAQHDDLTNKTNGPGTLATVTFEVVGSGDSDLILGPETRLIRISQDGTGPEQNIVDDAHGVLVDGYFANVLVVTHDIAITDVSLEINVSMPLWTIEINVTVLNEGSVPETFDVKVYYDYLAPNWLIGTETVVALANGTSTILTITWNVPWDDDISFGYHTIKVKALLSFNIDEDPSDNQVDDGTVWITLQADVDLDQDVDGGDQRKIQNAMFSSYPQALYLDWNSNVRPAFTDVDRDGDVDGGDQRKCQNNMFRFWPEP